MGDSGEYVHTRFYTYKYHRVANIDQDGMVQYLSSGLPTNCGIDDTLSYCTLQT